MVEGVLTPTTTDQALKPPSGYVVSSTCEEMDFSWSEETVSVPESDRSS